MHGLVYVLFGTIISIVWVAAHCEPLNYGLLFWGGADRTAGRYLYPIMASWFLTTAILLFRPTPAPLGPDSFPPPAPALLAAG